MKKYLVTSGQKVDLKDWDTSDTDLFSGNKEDAEKEIEKLTRKL